MEEPCTKNAEKKIYEIIMTVSINPLAKEMNVVSEKDKFFGEKWWNRFNKPKIQLLQEDDD